MIKPEVEARLDELKKTPRCGDNNPLLAHDSVVGLIDMILHARPSRVLEIGSDRGVSTECFLLLCDHVTVIDPWCNGQDRYDSFKARTEKYRNLDVFHGYSPQALIPFLAGPSARTFDLVYVDAVHVYQNVIDDVRAAFPLIRRGGWIAGHDYVRPFNEADVIPAVDALFGLPGVIVFNDGSWLAQKPESLPETPPAAGDLLRSPSIPDAEKQS